VLPAWPAIYASELAKTPGFTSARVEQAATDIDRLDAATS